MAFLEVEDLKVHFPIHGGLFGQDVDHVKAVDGVRFRLKKGKLMVLLVNLDLEKQRLEEQSSV